MRKKIISLYGTMLCGGFTVAAMPVTAQTDAPSTTAATGGLEEIIVTAIRREQSLQEVPLVVTAIDNARLQELNITQMTDIQVLSPGLSIANRGGATGVVTTLRGVSTTTTTGAPTAVVIYFNEVPINDTIAFTSIYDIGQIEILRGPQGTLRGAPSPAGSITLTTRRPDLEESGGAVDVSFTDQQSLNTQGAVNIPIVQDRLALRIAGLYDGNEAGDVKSVTTGVESEASTKSVRASLLWKPIDALSILGTYQYLRSDADRLTFVEGPGRGYNGPPIPDGSERLAVQEKVAEESLTADYATLSAKYNFGPATLSYIGGYTKFDLHRDRNGGDDDVGNAVPGFSASELFDVPVESYSSELRVDGSALDEFWDYTVGGYYSHAESNFTQADIAAYLPGAFADPSATIPTRTSALEQYVLRGSVILPIKDVNKSIFASSTFHLPTRTDITIGARRLWVESTKGFSLNFAPASIAVDVGLPNAFCSFVPGSTGASPYPTSCNFPVAPGAVNEANPHREFQEWVYDAKIAQHLSDDVMLYASYGHGFRGPGSNQGTAVPSIVRNTNPEESDSVELGLKSEFLDGRVRLNAAVFQQDFDGFISRARNIPNVNEGGQSPTNNDITFNGDAQIRGAEADVYVAPSDRFYVQSTVGYAKGEFKDASIPCRDIDGNGQPDNLPTPVAFTSTLNPTTPINFCRSSGAISDVPEWNATLLSEVSIPVGQATGYVRGLFTWQSTTTDLASGTEYDSYSLLNLYVGARGMVEGLDVNLFVKNIFDTQKVTYRDPETSFGGFQTGYSTLGYTQPREVGVSVRFSFGGNDE